MVYTAFLPPTLARFTFSAGWAQLAYTLLCRLQIRLDFVIHGMVTDLLRLSLREAPPHGPRRQC